MASSDVSAVATMATSTAPLTVSVAPAPGWTPAKDCPPASALSAIYHVTVTATTTDQTLYESGGGSGPGCSYRLPDSIGLSIMVREQSVDYFTMIFAAPPATRVREAPELGEGVILAATGPSVVIRQCVVLGPLPSGSLSVQVTTEQQLTDEQLCAPIGPALAVLATGQRR